MLEALNSKIRSLVNSYRHRPVLDLSVINTDPEHALTRYLLYYLMPVWAAAGLLDWYWHKRTDIEHTAGVYESLTFLHVSIDANDRSGKKTFTLEVSRCMTVLSGVSSMCLELEDVKRVAGTVIQRGGDPNGSANRLRFGLDITERI